MINLNKMWDFIIIETHRKKVNSKNLIRREYLFALQILLAKIEGAKKEKNQPLLKFCTEILEVFEKNKINSHILWKK